MSNILDIPLSLQQSAGNAQLARELLEMLLTELPDLREKLETAIVERDMLSTWDYAHKIYGSTAYCGVPALREVAKVLEAAVKEGNLPKIEAQFEDLTYEIDRLLEEGQLALDKDWIN